MHLNVNSLWSKREPGADGAFVGNDHVEARGKSGLLTWYVWMVCTVWPDISREQPLMQVREEGWTRHAISISNGNSFRLFFPLSLSLCLSLPTLLRLSLCYSTVPRAMAMAIAYRPPAIWASGPPTAIESTAWGSLIIYALHAACRGSYGSSALT